MELKRKRLFYDLETSFCKGYFWRPGWNQTINPTQITDHTKIISVHWSWEGEDEVHHLHWGLNKQCDKKLINKFIKELNKADEIITHNGKRFDTPWIRTRAMYHNIEMRYNYNEVDTMKWCKKYLNLPSNSLKEACKYFDLENKLDAGGVQTWVDVIFNKDQKALDHLLHYGDGDIKSLKALYYKLRPYAKPNLHYAKLKGLGKFCCPECGSALVNHNKTYATAAGTIQHYMKCRDKSCGTTFKINNKTYQDLLKFRMINNIK